MAVTIGQPPAAGIAYVTVYTPAVLEDALIAPEEEFIVKPTEEEYDPTVQLPVPEELTNCAVASEVQKGSA